MLSGLAVLECLQLGLEAGADHIGPELGTGRVQLPPQRLAPLNGSRRKQEDVRISMQQIDYA